MQRIMVGNGVCMITEIRKEAPVFPTMPRRRRLAALFAILLAVALFNVWISGKYYRMGYAVSTSLEEQRNLRKERDLLRTEILMLRSPARIEAIAKNQLGMVAPKTERILRVK
ncbi:MAG: cell division protein FtsL [Deltaproteobacteria bacterium]|nr:cell division protein FtsL [Deltaproteobacteria bacterium]